MTLYKIIGASQNASTEEIEAAFSKKLAELSLLHALGSEKAASMINELKHAKKILADPLKRAEYDRTIAADSASVRVDLRKPEQHQNRPISLQKPEREAAPAQEIMPQPSRSVELQKPVQTACESDSTRYDTAPINSYKPVSAQTEKHNTDHPLLSYLIKNAIALAVLSAILLAVTSSMH